MVQAFERERSVSKLRLFRVRKMLENARRCGNSFHENGEEPTSNDRSSMDKSRPSLNKDGNVARSPLKGQSSKSAIHNVFILNILCNNIKSIDALTCDIFLV